MATIRRKTLERVWIIGLVIGLPVAALFVYAAWATGASLLPVVLVVTLVVVLTAVRFAVPNTEYVEDESRPLPDIVYLTTRRVIVDSGLAWQSTNAMSLEVLKDVTLWQDGERRRAGVAWLYFLPIGATQVEARADGGELEPAPGVLEVQNLPVADAQALRDEALRRARAAQAALGMAPS